MSWLLKYLVYAQVLVPIHTISHLIHLTYAFVGFIQLLAVVNAWKCNGNSKEIDEKTNANLETDQNFMKLAKVLLENCSTDI